MELSFKKEVQALERRLELHRWCEALARDRSKEGLQGQGSRSGPTLEQSGLSQIFRLS
jgi:hypothetical protein